uniref:4a-hydroxytetrahydrobiopterin dehydratase n=1 Tax=Anthurium amnicola TaxID=1678845 RepID=A0A1D1ZJI5_9ARAE
MNALRRVCVRWQARPLHHHQPHPRPYLQLALLHQAAPRFVALSSFSSKAHVEGMDDLVAKQCVPCNSKDILPMSEHSAHELLEKSEHEIHGWDLVNEGGTLKLHRSWKVKTFTKGLEFFKLVADVAEAEGHHPDLHLVGWNNVKIELWTHSVGY